MYKLLTQSPDVEGEREHHVLPRLQHCVTAHEALDLTVTARHQWTKCLHPIRGIPEDQYTEVSGILVVVTPVRGR